jgi:N-methylhydantoinase A
VLDIARRLEPLCARGFQEILAEGILPEDIVIERFLDMRYLGQSYELSQPFSPNLLADFHNQHRRVYGHARPEAPLEIVNLRVRATGKVSPPAIPSLPMGEADPGDALIEWRPVILSQGSFNLPFYRGEALRPGNQVNGPAVVVRSDTTILVGISDAAEVDPFGNVLITIGNHNQQTALI